MYREYDSYDSMTLPHELSANNVLTVSYLRTDTDSVSVSVSQCHVSVMSVSCVLS